MILDTNQFSFYTKEANKMRHTPIVYNTMSENGWIETYDYRSTRLNGQDSNAYAVQWHCYDWILRIFYHVNIVNLIVLLHEYLFRLIISYLDANSCSLFRNTDPFIPYHGIYSLLTLPYTHIKTKTTYTMQN